MTTLPNQTIDTISRAVSNAFNAVNAKDADRKEAADQLTGAQNDAVGVREKLLTTLAAASHQHKWDTDQIAAGVDAAHAKLNDKKNASINTFAAEIRKAIRPAVRGHVAKLFELASLAWDAEGAADKGEVKPLRKAYARRYHMVVGAMFDATLAGEMPTTIEDLNEAAVRKLRGQQLDAAKVFKRLEGILGQLRTFHADFPVEGIGTCVEFLQDVSIDDLKGALANDAAASTPEAVVEDATAEPVQGVVDVIEDVLAEMAA